jgi:hypothetical protein
MKTSVVSGIIGIWLVSLTTILVQAQSYSITWYSIDGGGGVSTGGSYTLVGTVGQPDAGTATGGAYSMQGGFWPGVILAGQGELPTLYIERSGQLVVITWNPNAIGFVLESTLDLTHQVWSLVPPDNPGIVNVQPNDASRYYRLRKP